MTLQYERSFLYEPATVTCIATITKTNGRCSILLVRDLSY